MLFFAILKILLKVLFSVFDLSFALPVIIVNHIFIISDAKLRFASVSKYDVKS